MSTGGEHISRLVETPTVQILPQAKFEQLRYKLFGEVKTGGEQRQHTQRQQVL